MAYEKMDRAFPCVCGKGKMIAEWEEHDTWPSSNRSIVWRFECLECAVEYEFYHHHIVRKRDADKHRAMSKDCNLARRRVLEVATPRYEQKWVDYVLSLPTKKAMHRAIARYSLGTFLKQARSREWLEEEARTKFRTGPKECLDKLSLAKARNLLSEKVHDPEVSELNATAEEAEKAADAFWESIDKKRVPLD